MAYTIDQTGDIVINGWENGISDDPYKGLSDLQNVNLISIPGEASVNFATSKISWPTATGSVVSADPSDDKITISGTSPAQGAAVVFTGGSLPTGLTAGTVYWLIPSGGGTFQAYSDPAATSLVNITGTGTGTYATVDMGEPKYFTYLSNAGYWMVDANGRVWTSALTTIDGYWTFAGNQINNNSHGNGIVGYNSSNGTAYIFVFSDSSIDYATISGTTITWAYQWSPAAGTVGAYNANPTAILKTANGTNNPHEAILGPDNKVYFCDSNWIGRWYQTSPSTAFVPNTLSTYTFDQTSVLPFTDRAQCLSFLGNSLLIGGRNNIAYPWDTFSTLPSYPIMLPENNIVKIVTVNTNAFMLVGNRGRLYITNGSQAQLYKKIPDHLSGTVEPYFTWGGLASSKNQLYFSALVTTNGGTALTKYGGLWAIDLDTKAIRLTNKLSYGTYAGYATAIIANFGSSPSGTGLYIGWNDGASGYGLDSTVGTPYTGGQALVTSDLIPAGTFLNQQTVGRVEFKLAVPLVSGESVELLYRQKFSDSFTSIATFNTVGIFSGISQGVNFERSQWLQIQAKLTSTASSPSYVRLTEIRVGK